MKYINKFSTLLNNINNFCSKAKISLDFLKTAQTYTMPDDDDEPPSGQINTNLIEEADNYDFKNEILSNQFESFMKGYEQLIDNLEFDPKKKDEQVRLIGDLIDTLNTRWKRLVENPYLNMNEEEGWEEDFDPGDFTDFIQKVISDAEKQFNLLAGDDVTISDLKAAEMAVQFNNLQIDKADNNITWTGDKVKQSLEAQKTYFNKMKEAKKFGTNHSHWESYQKLVEARKQRYRKVMSNPELKAKFYERAYKVHEKFRNFDARRADIKNQIMKTRDFDEIAQLEKKLENLDAVEAKFYANQKKHIEKKQNRKGTDSVSRSVKSSGDLESLNEKLKSNISSVKMGLKKDITKKQMKTEILKNIESQEQTTFKPYLDAINKAKELGNENDVKLAAKQLQKAMNDAANSHPILIEYEKGAKKFVDLSDILTVIIKQNWMDASIPLEAIKDQLSEVLLTVDNLSKIQPKAGSMPNSNTIIILNNIKTILTERIGQ